ncbi:UrcA family protein [Polymorphobacter sp.]|uniref:UrcA family protein n=1 Tax=Polymorphobacter sp. TaxID=1909290 RepID=UPI003F715581
MLKSILPLAAIALVGAAGPALANAGDDAARQLIRYDNSALNSEAARQALVKRIAFAVRNVCGEPVTGGKDEIDAIRDCRVRAHSMAMAQVPVKLASN